VDPAFVLRRFPRSGPAARTSRTRARLRRGTIARGGLRPGPGGRPARQESRNPTDSGTREVVRNGNQATRTLRPASEGKYRLGWFPERKQLAPPGRWRRRK
jgi:hypothetical protein